METIEKTIEVEAPVSAVYNQWTQFEEFPNFMEGICEVTQLDDKRLHWVAEVAGRRKEWDAEIFEQIPDQSIAWRSMSGAKNTGQVSFQPTGSNATRICLRLNYDPQGAMENVGDALGVVSRRVEGDLKRFKEFIQTRQRETGAWRGEIHGKQVQPPGSSKATPPSPPGYSSMGTSGLSGSTGDSNASSSGTTGR